MLLYNSTFQQINDSNIRLFIQKENSIFSLYIRPIPSLYAFKSVHL